jgi:hypothetical protein
VLKKLNRFDTAQVSGTTVDDSSTRADNKKTEEIASPPSADRKKNL